MTYGSGNSGDYKKLKGQNIQVLDTDPVPYVGAWSSGGNMNTARWNIAGAGTQTSALGINGQSPDAVTNVEEYNGSSWSEVAENNTARTGGGASGSNAEAVLFFAGQAPPGNFVLTEIWNGSGWTEVNNMNTARYKIAGIGTSTAALAFGGNTPAPAVSALNESWNGTSWTEVGNLNTARTALSGTGTQTSALGIGGNTNKNETEAWNGSSWTEVADLATGRETLTGAGTTLLALAIGGATTAAVANTEEWTVPQPITNVVMTD